MRGARHWQSTSTCPPGRSPVDIDVDAQGGLVGGSNRHRLSAAPYGMIARPAPSANHGATGRAMERSGQPLDAGQAWPMVSVLFGINGWVELAEPLHVAVGFGGDQSCREPHQRG